MTIEVPTPEALLELAKANLERPTDWEVAFHEAAHVVAEHVTNRSTPDWVQLNDDPADDSHAGRTASRSFLGIQPVGYWADKTDDQRVIAAMEERTKHYAVTLAAGEVAAQIARGLPVEATDLMYAVTEAIDCGEAPESSDDRAMFELVSTLSYLEADVWLEARCEEAETVLREHWPLVGRLAAALVEHRRLDRDDLWEILS